MIQQHISDTNKHEHVRRLIATATRIPESFILDQADFEDDLGIDSVKGGEIVSKIMEVFLVSSNRQSELMSQRTLLGILDVLNDGFQENALINEEAHTHVDTVEPLNKTKVQSHSSVEEQMSALQSVFASVTRLPEQYITPEADFEDDLGIDSVMLGRIRSELAELYPNLLLPQDVQARSLNELIAKMEKTPIATHHHMKKEDTEAVTMSVPVDYDVQEKGDDLFLQGKVVLISGSGRGLGRVMAQYFARMGAHVVVNSFHNQGAGEGTVESIRHAGGKASHVWGSFANKAHIERMITEIEKDHGGIDMFVHNASNGRFSSLSDATDDDLEKAWKTNVLGFQWATLAVARSMRKRGGGRVVALSATYAHQYMDYFGVLGPAKAGMENLVGFLTNELIDDNIQINTVIAGSIDGEVMRHYPEHDRIVTLTESGSQGKRRCTEQEVAVAVGLLLRPEAGCINGAKIVVDRGMMK